MISFGMEGFSSGSIIGSRYHADTSIPSNFFLYIRWDFSEVRRQSQKSDGFGESQTTFQIFRPAFHKVVRKSQKSSDFLKCGPEIPKAGRKSEESAGNYDCCLTFAKVVRLFQKSSDFFEIPSRDRKSTRLNSSHANISYAVF